MAVQAAISETVPLIVVGIVLLLVLIGFPFIPRPLALANRNHRLSRVQTGLMSTALIVLLVAVLAISYVGQRHFSEECMYAYWLVAAILGVITTYKIALESDEQ